MEEIWENGGGKGEIPLKHSVNFDDTQITQIFKYHLIETRNDVVTNTSFNKLKQRQNDIISQYSDFTLKLQVAKNFKDINVIFL